MLELFLLSMLMSFTDKPNHDIEEFVVNSKGRELSFYVHVGKLEKNDCLPIVLKQGGGVWNFEKMTMVLSGL